MPSSFEEYTSVLKGGTAQVGGSTGGSNAFESYVSGAGVKAVKPQQQAQPVNTATPIQVQPVTPKKPGLLSKLKTGFQQGGIGGAIANLFPTTQPQEVVEQNLKTFVEHPSPASYVTKEQANKFVEFLSNPIDTYIKTAQNEILAQPDFGKTFVGKVMVEAQRVVENVFQANPTIRGFAKGASTMYLNSSEEISKLYDKQLAEPTDALDKTLYKMGEIPAAAFAFLLGGEALKAVNFSKATLPILFATLGQTSAPYNTTVKQRIEKMPVDLIAGYLFGMLPIPQVEGLKDILSPQALKSMGGAAGIVGLQTFIDGLIFGMSPEEAAKVIPKAVTIAVLFHAMALGTGLIDSSTKSKLYVGRDTWTPSEVKDMVYNAGRQNTPAGKKIIGYADTATTLGKDLRINYMELHRSFLAEVLHLKTPEATRVKIDFVNKASQAQLPGKENALQPTATGVPTITPPPQGTPVAPSVPALPIGRVNFKVPGLPPEVTGSLVTIRPDNTASYNLEIAEGSRGQGIGAEAVKTIENAIIEKGITQVELPVKPESVGFFEKQGYKVVGEESKGIVPMEKTLTTEEQDNDVYKQVIKNGGITVNLGGKQPTKGVAFSPFKGLETIIDENNFTADDVTKFKKAHLKELSIPGNNIGIWKDGGKFYLDVSRVGDYTPETLQEAMDNQQLAAFDLESITGDFDGEIPLGKMENGVYTPTYEATNHPYLNTRKNRSASIPGVADKPVKVPTGGKVSKKTTVKAPRKTKPITKRAKRTEKSTVKKRQEKVSQAEPVTEDLGFNPKNLENLDSPVVSKETNKIIKRSQIAKQLSEKLAVPIRTGKFRRSALGIFKPGQKVVRIKGGGKSGGLPTIFHEVGHFIDSNLNLSKNINIVERKALMEEYAYTYEGKPRLQQQEAFAEFLRFRMTGQKERATRLAPKFSKEFDERMKDLPEIKEVLDTATADYQRWTEQPASAKVLSQISIGNPPKEGLGSRVTSGLHKLYTIFLDDLHPLSQFSELARRQGIKMRAEADPYILARTIRGWGGISDLFLNKGTFDPANYYHLEGKKPKMVFTGKSLSEILKPIAQAKAEDDLRIFLVSKRVVEDLAPRGIKTGIDLQDAKNAIEEVKLRHPDIDFEKVGQEIITYQDSLLKYAASPLKGLIGPEGLKKIKELNKYHVPFYRVMEELQSSGYMGKKKIAGNFGSPIKKIKGSEREIVDPLESIIKDTYAIINASERNSIGVAMANLSKLNFELGRLFEKVDSPMKATRVTGEEIVKGLAEKIGMEDLGETDKESLDELAMTIFRPTQDRGQNMLNVNMGDTKLVFQVDPDLFNAIQGLNQEDVGLIMKVLSLPAKTLRLGATLSPDFSVRNPVRDTFTATIFSDYGFKPGIDLIKGVFDLVNPEGDVYNLWKAGGGQGSMFVSVDRQRLQENYKQLVATKGEKILNILRNPIELLKLSSEIGEEATRLGEMRNALVSGASPKQAAFASREVTLDFARIGAKTRAVNMIKAFFNSQIQGTDKMIRAFKAHPFRSLLKSLLLLTLPTILLYFANRKDKRWKEIPQWQKDLFWIVLTNPSKVNSSGIWRIPKPFEVGMLFASVPERVLEYIDTKNSDKLDALAATIMNGVLPDLNPIPSAGIPIVENMTNYSFFLKRPIVSRGQENLPPEAQYGAYTSETAKIVGTALDYSPSKIDNLIQGYAGGLGNYATELLDTALKGTGIATPPPAPASDFENMPVLRAFTIRNPVGSSSESVNTVYKKYGQISVEMNYVTKLAKSGEEQKAIDYVKKHKEVINAPLLNDTIETFSAINKKIDEIRRSKDLTPREKKDLIDRLGQAQTDLAKNVLEQLKSE